MVDTQSVLEDLARKSYDRIAVEPEDYRGNDGFWYCGKCRTPKEQITEAMGQEWRHMIPCRCEAEKIKAREAAERHANYREELLDRCFRYPEMRDWTFANDNGNNPDLTSVCRNFVDQFEEFREAGRGLLLYGSPGIGKSWFAACVANELIERETACKFLDFTQIGNELIGMGNGRNDYIEVLARYPLLILDDLDAERNTSFMDEVVFSVIDARTKVKGPLLITTNLTKAELSNPKGTAKRRIISRLYQVCMPYEVVGTDQRYGGLTEDYRHFKKLLGI